MSVPKIIHYCWFGGNPKPKLAEKCIKSWKKFCPDYQIIEWNEENFDVSAAPEYVCQAYAAKRWAFVTDYVRLKAMTEMGGHGRGAGEAPDALPRPRRLRRI